MRVVDFTMSENILNTNSPVQTPAAEHWRAAQSVTYLILDFFFGRTRRLTRATLNQPDLAPQ